MMPDLQKEFSRAPFVSWNLACLVLMIDTGCGCGDIYAFVKQQSIIKEKKIIVVNTHNHPEQ
ncbi:hypothetical protein TELCIR_25679, partial [Teladorsagia circumcincta]